MRCPSCNHDNRPGRKFCVECGTPLPLACGVCGAPHDAGEKFCGDCGATLRSAAARASAGADTAASVAPGPADFESRKVVSIVFADLAGSTALHERLDAESARRVMDRYYQSLTAVVDAHGGTVVKLLGDGVMAAFGLRRVAEDDAVRAVKAAVAMQEAFRELAGAQPALDAAGLRVGVNTGEVVVSGAGDDVVGDPVNVAARLQEQGGDGDVVIGESTRRLVATRVTLVPLGSIRLKGRTEAVAAYRVESLDPPPTATAAPFVGRDVELRRLGAVYEAAVAMPAARLAVVLGSPGLGKSRLVGELSRRLGDEATVLTALCDAAGGATFAPLVVALRALLGIDAAATPEGQREAIEAALGDDADRTRIADGIVTLLSGSPATPEETFFVVRRLLAAMARQKPVVLVIDDVHWAEPLLLDLVEHLVQWGSGVPLFVLVGARPELRELRSSLVMRGDLVSEVVTLGGLDAGAAMRLAANAIGASDLPAAVAAKVLATSEGNPLFVGELVRMLVQEGALTKEGDRWIVGAGLASIEMPPTIHALLAARIERLRPEERTVLERASVVGRYFSRSAVAALLGLDTGDLDARLESLRRSELIERDSGWLLGEPVQRFHHVLIRDAAYRRLLKGTRAELHERLADWIEGQVGDAVEHDETIGWHLEQAHQHLRELGPIDAHGRTLGERAATRLAAAGRRALARDDVPLAASLLGRAFDRLDSGHAARAELALDWCEALLSAGDVASAATAIDELGRFTEGSPRLLAWHTCFAAQLAVMTAPEELHAAAERVAAAARDLAALGDAAGEAKAHFVHANALARLGKVGACEAALDQALAAARRAGDRRRANAVLAGAPQAALWGPSPVTRASGRCLDVVRVLRITQGAPAVEAVALSCQGVLEALRGRTDAARRMLAASRAMVEELGLTQRLFEVDVFIARVDLLEGDAAAAERGLRPAYNGLRDLGLGIDAALAAALLARAVLAQGRAAEAEGLSQESELLAGDDLQAAIAWRGVRAEALAVRGEHSAAVELAKAAVGIASTTDALLDHADARVALAVALRSAGRAGEANDEQRRAIGLWGTKGATVLAERARRLDATTAAAAEVSAARAVVARSVRPNFATEAGRRFDAVVATGDVQALPGLWSDDLKLVDHAHGHSYGNATLVERVRMAVEEDVGISSRHEPLATLGASFALSVMRLTASESSSHGLTVGPTERPYAMVAEADEQACCVQIDMFLENKLNEALACLYERYAGSLPEGPARTQAAAVARSIAVWMGQPDFDLLAATSSPLIEAVDHRSLGTWSAKGREEWMTHWRWQADLTASFAKRCDDVLAAEPQAYLARTAFSGLDRAGGGTFENVILELLVFGEDGLLASVELFEPDQEAEALARFAALTGSAPPTSRARRRVAPNLATATCLRAEAAFASGDLAACASSFNPDYEEIDHPTGSTYGRDAAVASIERLMRSREVRYSNEPLATLGPRLALTRRRIAASGTTGVRFDVGAYENETLSLHEVDADGRHLRHEVFATDRLRTAIVRLYERYAESMPEGHERTRTRTIASVLLAQEGRVEAERAAISTAPAFVMIDHRSLGTWSVNGREDWLEHIRVQNALAADFSLREDDILALTPDAFLARHTYWGRERSGGGAFENVILMVGVFGADGLFERAEIFEPDREVEAFACFDALTGDGDAIPAADALSSYFANAATRFNERLVQAWAARDWETVVAIHERNTNIDDRRRLLQLQGGHELHLAFLRDYFDRATSRWCITPIATRGELLALSRVILEGDVDAEGGEFVIDFLAVDEVGTDGTSLAVIIFELDDLDQAYAELDRRFDAGEGAALGGFVGRSVDGIARRDWDALIEMCSPDMVEHDHRPLTSVGTTKGRESWVRNNVKSWTDLAPDTRYRRAHVRTSGRANFCLVFWEGTRDGGRYELPLLLVSEHDEQERCVRLDVYDPATQFAAARARFEELGAADAAKAAMRPRTRPNAATRWAAALESAFERRDLDGIAAMLGDPLETIEHPTGTTYGREGQIETCRRMLRLPDLELHAEPMATLGDSLCLFRRMVTAAGSAGNRLDFGEYELESIVVNEVDEAGLLRRSEVFASDHLVDATARLYTRYVELLPEGAERTLAAGVARHLSIWDAPIEGDRIARIVETVCPSYVCIDHRSLGTWSAHGREQWRQQWREQVNLAAGFFRRDRDILAFATNANVTRTSAFGTGRASGGAFENAVLTVTIFDADGLLMRNEVFEPEQEAEALARFDELTGAQAAPDASLFGSVTDVPARVVFRERVKANAVTRSFERFEAALASRDAGALESGFDESLRVVHHPTAVTYGRRGMLATWTSAMKASRLGFRQEVLATLGNVLSLDRHMTSVEGLTEAHLKEFGAIEIDEFSVIETDERGRWVHLELFALDQLGKAVHCLYERYAERLPAGQERERATAMAGLVGAVLGPLDRDRMGAILGPHVDFHDHRRLGLLPSSGREGYLLSLSAFFESADDVTNRLDDVLALGCDAFVFRLTNAGIDRRSGGAFERPGCFFAACGADGSASHWEFFDPDREADALARFDALERDRAAGEQARFVNVVSSFLDGYARAFARRDWPALIDCFASSCDFDDRRPLLRMQLPREGFLEQHRTLFDVPNGRWTITPIATRGEQLMLVRMFFEGDVPGGGGALEIDHRIVFETDADALLVALVLFAPEDMDAAYAELDRRFEAGLPVGCKRALAPNRIARAFSAHDPETLLIATCAPGYALHDHRRLQWGSMLSDPAVFIRSQQLMYELAPDYRVRVDHVRFTDRGTLGELTEMGTRDGGEFETPYLCVYELDDQGLMLRGDLYDLEQIDLARARFAELADSPQQLPERSVNS